MKFYLALLLVFAVSCCHHHKEQEEIDLQGFNWEGIKKCLSDMAPLIPEVYDLVQLIKKKDYVNALTFATQLIKKGIQVVKQCMEQFKTRSLLASAPRKDKRRHKHRFNPCAMKCKKQLNITWDEAKNSTEFKECIETCKAEWEKKKEERKEETKKCLEECEKIKEQEKETPEQKFTPYQKCVFKCRKPHWKKHFHHHHRRHKKTE